MFKNVATSVVLFAFDATTGLAKTGDGSNITPYVSKDYGTVTVLGTATATELDSTNAKGWYKFTVAQAETNADALLFTGKSSTANIAVVGQYIFTTPNHFSGLVIDSSGLADANMVKAGPSGSGTAQTARDIGASVLLSAGTGTGQLDFTSGVVKSSLSQILGTALTETSGQIAAAFKKFFNIATPASTMDALTLVATATNLTNAPTSGDLTATMKTSVTTAATAATPTAAAVTGAVGSVTGNVVGSVASVVARVTANADQLAGQTITAAAGVTFPSSVASPTNITAATGITVATNSDKTGYALTSAYDAAKTASSQTSVNMLQATADKLETTFVDSGGSPTQYEFTATALANAPTGSGASAADIADAVWDEATADHQTTGTTGKALTSASSAGDPWSSVLGAGLLTAGDMMLVLVAVAAGKSTVVPLSVGSATVTFRDLADTKDSVAATMSGSQRVSVTLNP